MVALSLTNGRVRRAGVWFVLAAVLLAACKGSSATPTPSPAGPAASSRPAATTPAVTPTPHASPPPPTTTNAQSTLAAYLADWQAFKYSDMYALLAPSSRNTLSAADFTHQYTDTLSIMSASAVTPTVKSVDVT